MAAKRLYSTEEEKVQTKKSVKNLSDMTGQEYIAYLREVGLML